MVASLKRPKAAGLSAGLKGKPTKKVEEDKVEKSSPDLLEQSDEEKDVAKSPEEQPKEDEKMEEKSQKPPNKGLVRPKGLGARINTAKSLNKDLEKKDTAPKTITPLPTLQKKEKEIPKSDVPKKLAAKQEQDKKESQDSPDKEDKENASESTKAKKLVKPKRAEQKETKKEVLKQVKKKEEKIGKKSGSKTVPSGRKQKKRKNPESSIEDGSDSDAGEGFDDSNLSENSDNEDGGTAVIMRKKIRKSLDGKDEADKPKEIRMVLSGFEKGERSSIHEIVKDFGGKIVENVDMETTHIIAKSKRTIKLLLGAARGIWVLSPNWVYSSKEEGKWLKEDDFEVEFLPGPRNMRLKREQGEPGLLFGAHVAIFGETNPSPRDLEDLVLAADGEVAQYYDHCKFCIASEGEEVSDDYAGLPIVTEKYLLDSLSEGRLRPMQEYRHPSWRKESVAAGAKA